MNDIQAREAFFVSDGDDLVPQPIARSYWGLTLHGRLIGGLTARAVEQARREDPDLVCTRLTIDMFRTAQLDPVQVTTVPIREGRRIRVLEVSVTQGGVMVGQGRAVLLRSGEQPPGQFPATPGWDGPGAAPTGGSEPRRAEPGARWTSPWDTWPVRGPKGTHDGMWIRENHDLVQGEPITPLIRVSMAADLASPIANTSTEGLGFINADYTIYLGREPVGDYVGMQLSGHVSAAGVAVGQCILHDPDGALGFIATAAVATPPVR
jgi:hypothetical protein